MIAGSIKYQYTDTNSNETFIPMQSQESSSETFSPLQRRAIETIIRNFYNNQEKETITIRENMSILKEIAQLEDNWNGYGASKFSPDLIYKCIDFILLKELTVQPEIFPTARKSIQFEYEPDEDHYLEVEVFSDKIKAYKRSGNKKEFYKDIETYQAIKLIEDFNVESRNS